jgi:hypothetical protein
MSQRERERERAREREQEREEREREKKRESPKARVIIFLNHLGQSEKSTNNTVLYMEGRFSIYSSKQSLGVVADYIISL